MATLVPPVAALRGVRRPGRGAVAVGVLLAWAVLSVLLQGRQTLSLAPAALTPLHRDIDAFADSLGADRASNPLFLYGFDQVRAVIDAFVTFVQDLIAQPAFGRPVPVLGWLGVVALATLVALRGNLSP